MRRQSVESSNIASVGYDAKKQLLEIEFNHGGIYQYFAVPECEYNKLLKASSHGKYFVNNIKDDYQYERLK